MDEERNIQTVNMPDLDSIELARVRDTIESSYDKLRKIVGYGAFLKIHFKQYRTTGMRKKHSVHLKLSFPGKTILSSESGWSLITVLQKAFAYLERETIKAVKTSS